MGGQRIEEEKEKVWTIQGWSLFPPNDERTVWE